MKEAAAYVLCVLGGKAAPSASDVKVRQARACARACRRLRAFRRCALLFRR